MAASPLAIKHASIIASIICATKLAFFGKKWLSEGEHGVSTLRRRGGICYDFVCGHAYGWDVDEDGNLKLQKDVDQLFSQILIFQSYQTFCRIIRWRNNEWISSYETQTSWWLETTNCHERNIILFSEVFQQLWFWLQLCRLWWRNFGCDDQQLADWVL